MRQLNGWWIPNENDALCKEITVSGYQTPQREKILDFLKKNNCPFKHCLDIGSHIGLWSKPLLDHFKRITAFEPVPILYECYEKNIQDDRVTLYKLALGSKKGKINLKFNHTDTGGTHVSPDGNTEVYIDMLDNFNLGKVDYIKMDVEGYEFEVLKGATTLLAKQSPILHLELKIGSLQRWSLSKDVVKQWLGTHGYKQVLKIGNEFIFSKNKEKNEKLSSHKVTNLHTTMI